MGWRKGNALLATMVGGMTFWEDDIELRSEWLERATCEDLGRTVSAERPINGKAGISLPCVKCIEKATMTGL